VGITLFNLLTNDHAFKGKSVYDLANSIKTKEPDLALLGEGRDQLKSLLRRIFEKDPEKRITVYEILDDTWVTDDGLNTVNLDMIDSS